MYVCMYVCMCVCMYVYCIYIFICMYICIYIVIYKICLYIPNFVYKENMKCYKHRIISVRLNRQRKLSKSHM